MGQAFVSVIVPAYNAEQFIERTLESAAKQTYDNIEIIVIDDGSTDRTASIVERLAKRDHRLRLIRQHNEGVAAARNRGISASRGGYLAPLDSDDLWHATKLEKQLNVFAKSGPDLGLVYTLCRIIDADDLVIDSFIRPRPDGWVFLQHANNNFIGNGSSPLLRREAVEQVGGYSSRLRLSGIEGCEDLLLQLSIASKYKFGLVPEYLVGYRRTPMNMSSNALRMVLSKNMVLKSLCECCSPAAAPGLVRAIYRNDVSILRYAVRYGHCLEAARACARIARLSPFWFLNIVREFVLQSALERACDSEEIPGSPHLFQEHRPTDCVQIPAHERLRKLSANLRSLDNKLGPKQLYLLSCVKTGTMDKLTSPALKGCVSHD
jgi:hypothetical protein